MPIDYNKIRVRVRPGRIVRNYRRLEALDSCCAPVIKSDAYGHGLVPVAKALAAAGARTLAVGTADEAAKLRDSGFSGEILALLGAIEAEDNGLLWRARVVPAVFDLAQLERLQQAAPPGAPPLEVALKFDTGMARLGFAPNEAGRAAQAMTRFDRLRATLAMSHLTSADDPEAEASTREQGRGFARIVQELRAAGLRCRASLCNSAGIMAFPQLRHELQRPGIALYGANPFAGTSLELLGRDLEPAMEVSAPVLQMRDLSRGRSVSYGRTFVAARDMRVAVVAAGYADGYSRSLSSPAGQGPSVMLRGARAPILGRVCMQMCVVDVSGIPDVAPGDRAWLLGAPGEAAIRPEELAGWWGTIPYEVFCVLGCNPREVVADEDA